MRGNLSRVGKTAHLSCVDVTYDGAAFGRRVASAREWAGLEPKELARRVGVHVESINRIERGGRRKQPRKAELRLLAEALGQTEEWLLEGEVPPWVSVGPGHRERPEADAPPEQLQRAKELRRVLRDVERILGEMVDDG